MQVLTDFYFTPPSRQNWSSSTVCVERRVCRQFGQALISATSPWYFDFRIVNIVYAPIQQHPYFQPHALDHHVHRCNVAWSGYSVSGQATIDRPSWQHRYVNWHVDTSEQQPNHLSQDELISFVLLLNFYFTNINHDLIGRALLELCSRINKVANVGCTAASRCLGVIILLAQHLDLHGIRICCDILILLRVANYIIIATQQLPKAAEVPEQSG